MKSVLISVKPKYCELIASGQKTVEVRKNRPKIAVPFKVYIYQSKDNWIYKILEKLKLYQQKVIGEFVCNGITSLKANNLIQAYYNNNQQSCLSDSEIMQYANGKKLFYWHISNLKIYDKPKELSEFYKLCSEYQKDEPICEGCDYEHTEYSGLDCPPYFECKCEGLKPIQCPPQSWCYVEELGADRL